MLCLSFAEHIYQIQRSTSKIESETSHHRITKLKALNYSPHDCNYEQNRSSQAYNVKFISNV